MIVHVALMVVMVVVVFDGVEGESSDALTQLTRMAPLTLDTFPMSQEDPRVQRGL